MPDNCLFRDDGEFYIANDPGEMYSMYVGVQEFDLPKIRLNSSGTLKVSGLPAGLKYVLGTSSIEGIATKDGIYTVYLTVGKLVSTFTIEVKPLPDWVVGTFEGCGYDSEYDGGRFTCTVSKQGKVLMKAFYADEKGIYADVTEYQLLRFRDGAFEMEDSGSGVDHDGDYEEWTDLFVIFEREVNGVSFGSFEGEYYGRWESLYNEYDYGSWVGAIFGVQDVWKKDISFDFLPEIVNGTEMFVDLTGWKEKSFDDVSWNRPVDGCSLRLKFGKNGAVTAAFYEPGATKATGTASATLMPYDRVGNTVKALLTIAIAPKGRHSICVALYRDIDVSRGVVYGDDMTVTDY